jgi:hypothetical protein
VKAVCSWCRAEGRPGLIGESPPFDDPAEVEGVCWQHKVDLLVRTRTLSEAPVKPGLEADVRFLVVIGRHHEALLRRVSEGFLDDPRVRVLVDRRQRERRQHQLLHVTERRHAERRQPSDYWEDVRYHPVVLVPIRKSPDAGRAVTIVRTAVPEATAMDDPNAEVRRQIEQWARAGQNIVGNAIPALFQECDALRKRAESAEARVDELQAELGRQRAEMDRLRLDSDAVSENVDKSLREIGRITTEVLLKLKSR